MVANDEMMMQSNYSFWQPRRSSRPVFILLLLHCFCSLFTPSFTMIVTPTTTTTTMSDYFDYYSLSHNDLPSKMPKMIVFDKDGTLGDCTPALRTWCTKMTSTIQEKCSSTPTISTLQTEHIISNFHKSIGWDITTNDVIPSAPLSAGTWDEIITLVTSSLQTSGLSSVQQSEVMSWHHDLGDIHANDSPLIPDLPRYLQQYHNQGIIISICTSDDRDSTTKCMANWGITNLVDYSICGDELDPENCKPSPEPLYELCRRAGVLPSECLVVGDTSNDTQMGLRGGAGFVVGVLTGSGTEDQLLQTGANVVLPNIGYLDKLLLLSSKSVGLGDIRQLSIGNVMDIDMLDRLE